LQAERGVRVASLDEMAVTAAKGLSAGTGGAVELLAGEDFHLAVRDQPTNPPANQPAQPTNPNNPTP
jgi:hypothetical protein